MNKAIKAAELSQQGKTHVQIAESLGLHMSNVGVLISVGERQLRHQKRAESKFTLASASAANCVPLNGALQQE